MSAQVLLKDLRQGGVALEADGDRLRVDAPAGVVTEELRTALAKNKRAIIKLLSWERRKLEEAGRRGLIIRWVKERGWIALHDPTTGEWHEVRASECLPSVVQTANKYRKKGGVA